LDEAHTAVGRHTELAVVAEARHVNVRLIGYLDQHLAFARFQRHAIHFYFYYVVAHWPSLRNRHAAARRFSTMLRPPFSTMYSNSWRKCLMKLCTGQAAASPRAQIV